MAETNGSLQQSPTQQSLFRALDPISLILSQTTSNSDTPLPLKLTSFYSMERGPRYSEYAELRESKLRMKRQEQEEKEGSVDLHHQFVKQTPPKKQVKFQTNAKKGSSVLYQSVPDFSATLRKENRKPRQELTPPMPTSKNLSRTSSNNNGVLSTCRGSKSANAGEKRNGGILARKSYANVEELRGLSMAASTAINGETRRGGARKTFLGYRQF